MTPLPLPRIRVLLGADDVMNGPGGDACIIGGWRRRVKLEEVPVERRAPIIKEYIRLAPGARPHVGLGPNATIEECQSVAPNHPVFRIVYRDESAERR